MKEKLILLLLVCLCFVPSLALAQQKRELDILDRSRINEGRMKMKFEMGGISITGYLENTNTPSEDKLQEIIRQVMKSMDIYLGNIENCIDYINEAQHIQGVNWWFLGELAVRAAGKGELVDWYKNIKNREQNGKEIGDLAVDYMLEKAGQKADVPTQVREHFFRFALDEAYREGVSVTAHELLGCIDYVLALPDAILALDKELKRLDYELELLNVAAERAAVMGVFYNLVNIKIMEELEKGEWVINFDKHQELMAKTLFDIPIKQQSKIRIELKRVDNSLADPEDPSDWSGVYRGKFLMELYHNSKELDRVFVKKIFFNNHLPYDDAWPEEVKKQYELTDESKPSTLSRIIEKDNFQVTVYKTKNQIYNRKDADVFRVTDGTFRGNTEFLVGPIIEAGLIHLMNGDEKWSTEQHVSGAGFSADQKSQNHFGFTAGVTDQTAPYLRFDNHFFDSFGEAKVSIPYQEKSIKWDNSTKSDEGPRFVIDYNIFEEFLEEGRIYVKARTHNSYLLKYNYLDHIINHKR